MKRYGNLIEQIADIDNIRYAFYLACKGKHKKKDVQNWLFGDNEERFRQIREMFLTKNIRVGDYHSFKVYEPKERMIYASAFEERVLQHALMRVCGQIFDKYQISDSYACRVGKGQYKALEQARENHAKTQWYVKMDVRKCFDSINHDVLKSLLRRRFKDKYVLNAFEKIIDSYKKCGLPIGNLTSQYFANYYLGVADHFIKENLQIKYYVRYMDDMVIWGNDKQKLLAQYQAIRHFFLFSLRLDLKEICHNKTCEGLPFLGYRIMKNYLKITRSCKQRFERKLALYRFFYNHNLWNRKDYFAHAEPLTAFLIHADTLGLRQRINKKYPLLAS